MAMKETFSVTNDDTSTYALAAASWKPPRIPPSTPLYSITPSTTTSLCHHLAALLAL